VSQVENAQLGSQILDNAQKKLIACKREVKKIGYNSYRLLGGKPEGRRPLGRPRRRWLDNMKMDLVEVGFGDVYWACSTNREKRNAYRLLVGKARGKEATRKNKT
jgi:hypothetical protein